MICAACEREIAEVKKLKPDDQHSAALRSSMLQDIDYLCARCRKVEDVVLSQKFPESDKLSELHNGEAGKAVQSFLSYLEAADMVICRDDLSAVIQWITADKLMREWAGIDEYQ